MSSSRELRNAPMRRIADDSIVTGAAVELDIHPASPLVRMAATACDIYIVIMAAMTVAVGLFRTFTFSESMTRVVMIGMVFSVFWLGPFVMEVATRGQSLGKWAFGLRVVRDDGGVVTSRHVAMRVLVGLVEVWATFGSVAFIASMVSPKGKRLGDLAAGTMVVQEPQAVDFTPVLMPRELVAWTEAAHILPLSASLQRQAMVFLRSNRRMMPQIRHAEAIRLAKEVALRVSPPPPPGTHPERFIAAVLVVTRNREYQRLLRRDRQGAERRQAVTAPSFGI